jgi:hypothetical protein
MSDQAEPPYPSPEGPEEFVDPGIEDDTQSEDRPGPAPSAFCDADDHGGSDVRVTFR